MYKYIFYMSDGHTITISRRDRLNLGEIQHSEWYSARCQEGEVMLRTKCIVSITAEETGNDVE